jgi:hypothetical protein
MGFAEIWSDSHGPPPRRWTVTGISVKMLPLLEVEAAERRAATLRTWFKEHAKDYRRSFLLAVHRVSEFLK